MSEISPNDLRKLLVENATLAERLEVSEADRERVIGAWGELKGELEPLRERLEEVRALLAAAEKRADSLQEERNSLSERLMMADAQLRDEERAPALPPSEVSALVNRFLSGLDSQLSGLTVRDGEMQLKVGFEKVGQQQGFVVPTPDSPPELRENLHTISVRLAREAD